MGPFGVTRGAQQSLPLPETRREGFEEKNFLRLQANAEASDALLAPLPENEDSLRVKALCGPAKCGKSHLGEIWRVRNNARALSPSLLQQGGGAHAFVAGRPLCWLDFSADEDPEQGMALDLERALYALYNEVVQSANGALLITARSEPSRWRFALADLRSRMRAVAVYRIADPSSDDSALLLEKIFRTRQLEVDPRVYDYVHRRIERSFRAHHTIADELDALSLAHKRKITLPLVVRHLSIAESAQTT